MGIKPRHRCLICHGFNIAVRYKRLNRKRRQRRFNWFCLKCEGPFLGVYSPSYIAVEQRRRYIGAKYGYEIQEEKKVLRNVQTS